MFVALGQLRAASRSAPPRAGRGRPGPGSPPCRSCAARSPCPVEFLRGRRELVVGVAQEDQPQHRDGVLRRLQLGVGPQLVGRVPQALLDVGVIAGHVQPRPCPNPRPSSRIGRRRGINQRGRPSEVRHRCRDVMVAHGQVGSPLPGAAKRDPFRLLLTRGDGRTVEVGSSGPTVRRGRLQGNNSDKTRTISTKGLRVDPVTPCFSQLPGPDSNQRPIG